MNNFEEMLNSIKKLHKIGVVDFWKYHDDDFDVDVVRINVLNKILSQTKILNRIESGSEKKNLHYDSHSAYSTIYIYEHDPFDKFF